MALGKQAKTLTKAQVDTLLLHVGNGRNGTRNRVVALLSVRAALAGHSSIATTQRYVDLNENVTRAAVDMV